jgi:hypothetical protein
MSKMSIAFFEFQRVESHSILVISGSLFKKKKKRTNWTCSSTSSFLKEREEARTLLFAMLFLEQEIQKCRR